jgi:hypothetical protein
VLVKKIVEEAHRQGLQAWSHGMVFPATPQEVIDAGPDTVSHVGYLQCDCVGRGNPERGPVVGCHKSGDCEQTQRECARVNGGFRVAAGWVDGGAPPSGNSRCARPGARHRARLPCIGRSSARFGPTARRHFGEDAQRFF